MFAMSYEGMPTYLPALYSDGNVSPNILGTINADIQNCDANVVSIKLLGRPSRAPPTQTKLCSSVMGTATELTDS